MLVEKRELDTPGAIARLAREFGVDRREFGRAGLKDGRAETTQLISVRGVEPDRARGLELDRLRVLWAEPHEAKLRPGALRGNRFRLRLRPAPGLTLTPEAGPRASRAFERLVADGVLNRFGAQRLGPRHRTALAGLAMLQGNAAVALGRLLGSPLATDSEPVQAARGAAQERGAATREGGAASLDLWPSSHSAERRLAARLSKGERPARVLRALPRERAKLHVHAAQSLLFEKLVDRRAGSPARLEIGDVVRRLTGRGTYRVESLAEDAESAARFEIVPMLPLFGRKLFPAGGDARRHELDVLRSFGLHEDTFADRKERGDRRALRVGIGNPQAPVQLVDRDGQLLELRFELPPGSYATTLLEQWGRLAGRLTEPRV